MRSFPRIALTCTLAVLAGHALPDSASAQTLQQAIRQAVHVSPRLDAERARYRAETEKLPQARAGLLPAVSLSAGYGPERDKTRTMTTTRGSATTGTAGLSVSQPLFDGMRAVNDVRRAGAEVAAGREGLAAAEADLVVAAAEAYMGVLRDRRIVRLREENLSILRGQVSSAAARHAAGDASKTAVAQARTRVAEAEGDLAQARADLSESEAAWRAIIGDGQMAPVMPRGLGGLLPKSREAALAQAEAANPNLRSAAFLARAAQHGIAVARAGLMPRVSLDGDLSHDLSRDARGSQSDTASMKVRLAVPLFSGGSERSKVRQAHEVSGQRGHEFADLRLQVRKATIGAWAALEAARTRKSAAGRRIDAAHAAVSGLNAEFASGMIAFSELLDSRRELVNARISAVIADYDEVVSAFLLMAATGSLASAYGEPEAEPVVATGSVNKPARTAAVPTPPARPAAAQPAAAVANAPSKPVSVPVSAPAQPAKPATTDAVRTAEAPAPVRRAPGDPWADVLGSR
jgi:outer membrane protein